MTIGIPSKNEAKKFLLFGMGLVSTNILLFYAFNLTTLANTIILHYTALLWASIASVAVFKENFTKWKTASMLLAITGIAIIFFPQSSFEAKYLEGNIFALASSAVYAVMILASRGLKNTESKKSALYCTLACAIVSIPFFIFFTEISSPTEFFSTIAFGTIYVPIEALLLLFGMAQITVITAGLILALEIPATIIFGTVFYGEIISLTTFFGGALIALSVLMLIFKEKQAKI